MINKVIKDLDWFQSNSFHNKEVIVIPIYLSSQHSKTNSVIQLFFFDLNDNKEFITDLPINSLEWIKTEIFPQIKQIKVEDKKSFLYFYNGDNIFDLTMNAYLQNKRKEIEEPTKILNKIYQRAGIKVDRLNKFIPIAKHLQYAQERLEHLLAYNSLDIDSSYEFYDRNVIRSYFNIESTGLWCSDVYLDYFGNHYTPVNNRVYSKYNFYTLTGRPSNHFNGINFAAFKKTGERNAFAPSMDWLVEFDFSAYHPSILGNITDYDFKGDKVYEHLAKKLFNTDTPSEAAIKEAKVLTFRQLYGGIDQSLLHVPYFAAIQNLTDLLWHEYQEKGYIEMPFSKRRIAFGEITNTKLLNYFIQLYETERNAIVITDILQFLKNKQSKIILYTYDSILFDIASVEENILPRLKTFMTFPRHMESHAYTVHMLYGKKYGELQSKHD